MSLQFVWIVLREKTAKKNILYIVFIIVVLWLHKMKMIPYVSFGLTTEQLIVPYKKTELRNIRFSRKIYE